jgi:hypothetical protein
VIIWLNGTFGAGKTTTAMQLAGRLANARHFDPELVGYLLMEPLEPRQALPGGEEDLLQRVLGVLQRAEHLVAAQPERGLMRRDELTERVTVPALRPVDQVGGHAGMLVPTADRGRCLTRRIQ